MLRLKDTALLFSGAPDRMKSLRYALEVYDMPMSHHRYAAGDVDSEGMERLIKKLAELDNLRVTGLMSGDRHFSYLLSGQTGESPVYGYLEGSNYGNMFTVQRRPNWGLSFNLVQTEEAIVATENLRRLLDSGECIHTQCPKISDYEYLGLGIGGVPGE